MRLGNRFARVAALAASLLAALCFATSEDPPGASAAAQGGAQAGATTTAGGGLRTVIFDTRAGTIRVNLPDDMRAGDTVSGSLFTEPKGQTEAERARNVNELNFYTVELKGQFSPKDGGAPVRVKVSEPPVYFTVSLPPTAPGPAPPAGTADFVLKDQSGKDVAGTSLPIPTPKNPVLSNPTGFQLPTLGQQGRFLEIPGPFDGDASNTTLRFDPAGAAVKPLAESPRKMVFQSPVDLNGPAEISLREGGAETRGPYRSVGVRLSAPKTSLTRGERTTLTVEVSGLGGIKEDVPLQLDARGVIEMDGGSFQNLRIRPQEIQPDGRYTTTRAITGQQAGGFNVTATVIVRRFDMCLQDDANPRTLMLWNSFTGNYAFINLAPDAHPGQPGGKLQPGGGAAGGGAAQTGIKLQPGGGGGAAAQTGRATQTGGTPPTDPSPPPGGLSLTGVGRPAMKGCIITLSHNAPDRRVFARLDVCTNTGSGEVRPTAPKTNFDIKDTNTADSSCPGN